MQLLRKCVLSNNVLLISPLWLVWHEYFSHVSDSQVLVLPFDPTIGSPFPTYRRSSEPAVNTGLSNCVTAHIFMSLFLHYGLQNCLWDERSFLGGTGRSGYFMRIVRELSSFFFPAGRKQEVVHQCLVRRAWGKKWALPTWVCSAFT